MDKVQAPEQILEDTLRQLSEVGVLASREKVSLATYNRLFYEVSQVCSDSLKKLDAWRDQKEPNTQDEAHPKGNDIDATERCPKCGSRLKTVTGKYGQFIGCSNYPACRYSCSVNVRDELNVGDELSKQARYPGLSDDEVAALAADGDIDEVFEHYGSVFPEDVYDWNGTSW